MTRRSRRVTTVLVAGALAVGAAGAAHAGITGNATTTQSVTSASWGAKPTANDGVSPISLTWDSISSTAGGIRYFRIVNSGSASLTSATYSFAVNRTLNNGNNVPPTNFDVCVGGTFNTTTGLCSTNNIVTVAATSTTKFAVTVISAIVPAVNGFLSMRAAPQSANFPQPFTATVDASVTRSQVRAATTTNS